MAAHSATQPVNYLIVLDDLRRRRDELDLTIRIIEGFSRPFEPIGSILGDAPPASQAAPIAALSVSSSPSAPLQLTAYAGKSIAEAAHQLLSEVRHPMNSVDIASRLKAGGYPLNGADPGNTIGSVLTRRFQGLGDIVRVSRGMWGLAEWYPGQIFTPGRQGKKAEQSLNPRHVPVEAKH